MVMSFLDRDGFQTGYKNYDTDASDEGNNDEKFGGCTSGDALIASMNSDGTATLENNGEIDGDGGVSNGEGPGGGEFFHLDYWQNSQGDVYHEEIVQGGTAYLVGSDSIPFVVFDPVYSTANSGGVKFFKNEDGTSTDAKILYDSDENGSQGKSAGLGDLEILTDLHRLRLEIGFGLIRMVMVFKVLMRLALKVLS